jgi:hypothetical protein
MTTNDEAVAVVHAIRADFEAVIKHADANAPNACVAALDLVAARIAAVWWAEGDCEVALAWARKTLGDLVGQYTEKLAQSGISPPMVQ